MKNVLGYCSVLALALPVAHAQFTFTALGSLPGSGPTPAVNASGMNSLGHVCGSSSFLDTMHAYLWKPAKPDGTAGTMMDLGALIHPLGTNWSVCSAVSTWAPVGWGYDPATMGVRALVFAGEAFIGATTAVPAILPVPETPATLVPNSYAYGVNDSGTIVGSWTPESSIYHAMVWHPAGATGYTATDLNVPGFPEWVLTAATAVNKAGDVAGYGSFKGATHGFLLTKSGITDLGSLSAAPADYSIATGLNDKGQVVGYSTVTGPAGIFHHAFLWESGTMTDLGVPGFPGIPAVPAAPVTARPPAPSAAPTPFTNSIAVAINNNGKIVGWANTAPIATTAYEKTPFGWGVAAAYDTNSGAKPPELAAGWNLLNMPWVTKGAPPVPPGLVSTGAPVFSFPTFSSMIAAFAINDNDQIAGLYLKPGPLLSAFLLTAPLPLKP